MSVGFSAPCPYLLDDIEFCFHLNPIFQLLPSKTGTMKKNQNIEKKMADNSEPAPSKKKRYCVKFNGSLRNLGQVKVLLYVMCVEAISLLHMEEKMISINNKDTSKHKRYVDTAQRQKQINRFWCKLSDFKLKPKSSES